MGPAKPEGWCRRENSLKTSGTSEAPNVWRWAMAWLKTTFQNHWWSSLSIVRKAWQIPPHKNSRLWFPGHGWLWFLVQEWIAFVSTCLFLSLQMRYINREILRQIKLVLDGKCVTLLKQGKLYSKCMYKAVQLPPPSPKTPNTSV